MLVCSGSSGSSVASLLGKMPYLAWICILEPITKDTTGG